MKMIFARYWQALLVAFIMAAVTVVLSWLIDNGYKNDFMSLQTMASIASLLTSLLLFGAAWTLHQKYSGSQQVIDRKTEKVLDLIRLLQSVSLTVQYYKEKPENSNEVFNIKPIKDKGINEAILGYKNINNKHYFHESVMELYQDIITQSTDIFIPTAIVDIVREKLDVESMFSIELQEYKNVQKNDFIVFVRKISNSKIAMYSDMIENPHEKPQKVVSKYNGIDVSIDTLMQNIRDIQKEATKWLKKNSPYVLDDLNIY